jgi:predicted dehydrogenase
MVREHELDGVLLATWPNLHREQVLGCLEAGVRNILCEKSLAVTAAEAVEMWRAAEEAGALVVEGYRYRHHPALWRLLELVQAGDLGPLDNVLAAFSMFDPAEAAPDDPNRDWRNRPELGGGVPWDLAGYCIDACNLFARTRPLRALALVGTSERFGTIDRLYGLVEYESGLVALIESSKRSDFNHELRIDGARGRALLPVAWRIERPAEILVSRGVGWGEFDTERIAIPQANPYVLQLDAFVAAARGEASPTPTLAESVTTACTLDALLTSAAEHAAVPIDLPAGVAA